MGLADGVHTLEFARRSEGGYGKTVVEAVLLDPGKKLLAADTRPHKIEIVDSQARIDAFLPELDRMMTSGLVTLEKARVLRYGPGEEGSLHAFTGAAAGKQK